MTFEYMYDNSSVAYLAGLGHNVTWVAPGQAHCQAIRRLENGTFEAAGEPRMSSSGISAT
jgi:gamma-glutamyltranspeptidase / glutathione hydrolase